MTDLTGHHPILGPGFVGGRSWLWGLLLLALAFATGFAFTYFNPVIFGFGVAALMAGTVFVWFSATSPVGPLCLVIASQILVPVYIRLPLGLPPPLLMLAVLITVIALRSMLIPIPKQPAKYEHLIATLLLIYVAVQASTIPNDYASIGSLEMLIKNVIIPTFMFFVVLSCVRSQRQLVFVFRTITVAAFASAILGLQEFSVKKNWLAAWLAPEVTIEEDFFLWILANGEGGSPYVDGAIYRVYSFFTQPLEYSAFMVMAFPFSALMFVTAKSLWPRLIYGTAFFTIFAGFIVSFSRGPTLAFGLVILFLGIYEKKVRLWIFGGFIALGGGLLVYWPLVVEKLGDRVTGSDNITLRFSLWKNGLEIFLANPLRGIGFGTYPDYHVHSIRENQIGPMYEYSWSHIERVTTVENIFITLAAETGIMGLTAYLALLFTTFMVFKKVYRSSDDPETRVLALSAFAAILAYLLSGMTVANSGLYTISILFFGVFMAAIAILSRQVT